jgi:hypothetical protein
MITSDVKTELVKIEKNRIDLNTFGLWPFSLKSTVMILLACVAVFSQVVFNYAVVLQVISN